MGAYPDDYSSHSFRKGGLSVLADGEMHPRSFSLFLPKMSVKVLPPSAGVSLRRGTSVSWNSSSHSDGSSFPEETLSRKHSYASNKVESNDKRVRFIKNSTFRLKQMFLLNLIIPVQTLT